MNFFQINDYRYTAEICGSDLIELILAPQVERYGLYTAVYGYFTMY